MAILSEKIEGSMIELNISSTNLKSVKFDTSKNNLLVEFNTGSIYEYENVPLNVFNEFKKAESHGKYLNTNISKTYKYKKIS